MVQLEGLAEVSEPIVKKRHFSGFHQTSLRQELDGHAPIIIAGIAVDCCIMQTAFEASTFGDVFVPYQAVSATSHQLYSVGLLTLGKSAGVVCDLEGILGVADNDFSSIKPAEHDEYSKWYLSLKEALDRFKESTNGELPSDALEILEKLRHSSGSRT